MTTSPPDDEGYDHSTLCQRCHGRGFEPLRPPESRIALFLVVLGATAASICWAFAWFAFH